MKTNRGKAVASCRVIGLAIGLIAAALLAVSFFLDDAVLAFMKTHSTPGVVAFGRFGSHYGQWNWLMVPCIVVAIVAWVRKDRECLRILCVMVIASILAGGIVANVVRATTGRTRPNAPASIPQGWYGPRANGEWVVIKHEYNAFPSAHAAASMGLIFPLLLLRKRIGWVLLPVPILIAAARICVGAHHLSDVVAGAMVGMVIAVCTTQRLMARMFPGWEGSEGRRDEG